jgi:hypothetical protein
MTLFLAVVLDFVLLALIKIQSIAGITHWQIGETRISASESVEISGTGFSNI